MPYVHACVRLSRFYINLNISFIYKDIFKFAGNVMAENMSVQNFGLILKNKIENFNYLNVGLNAVLGWPQGIMANV